MMDVCGVVALLIEAVCHCNGGASVRIVGISAIALPNMLISKLG